VHALSLTTSRVSRVFTASVAACSRNVLRSICTANGTAASSSLFARAQGARPERIGSVASLCPLLPSLTGAAEECAVLPRWEIARVPLEGQLRKALITKQTIYAYGGRGVASKAHDLHTKGTR
jgi:hypothetical protein